MISVDKLAQPVSQDDTEEDDLPCWLFLFIWKVCITGTICAFGIVGNMLSLWLIHKSTAHKLAAPMILLLSALEVADILYVFIYSLNQVVPDLFYYCCGAERIRDSWQYIFVYMWPCAMIAMCCGNWFTVLISVHWFYALLHPLKGSELSSMKRINQQVISLTITSIVIDIPRFFELSVTEVIDPMTNETYKDIAYTDLYVNDYYQLIYKTILVPTYKFYVPMSVVTVLSIRIVHELKRIKKRRLQMLPRSSENADLDMQVTKAMLWIIMSWITLTIPSIVYPIYRNFLSADKLRQPCTPFNYFTKIADSLLVLNASINYIIYIMFSLSGQNVICGGIRAKLCCLRHKVQAQSQEQNVNNVPTYDAHSMQNESTNF